MKSNSLQGATGKVIKKTCPVKYAVAMRILTTHFKMKRKIHIRLQWGYKSIYVYIFRRGHPQPDTHFIRAIDELNSKQHSKHFRPPTVGQLLLVTDGVGVAEATYLHLSNGNNDGIISLQNFHQFSGTLTFKGTLGKSKEGKSLSF